MGSVERVLVLGIVVVIVAILGIAVWGATGDDAGTLAKSATDGGVVLADGPANSSALKSAPKDAGAAAVAEIDRWRLAREELRKQNRAPNTPVNAGAPEKSTNIPLKSEGVVTKPAAVKSSFTAEPTKPQVQAPAQPALAHSTVTMPEPEKAKGPASHTVVSGDSLWKITFKYFGDSNIQQNLDAILAANPKLNEDATLHIGTKIVIPNKAVVTAPTKSTTAAPAAKLTGDLYEVQAGDTLSEIASRLLGSSRRMNEIYELNRDRMTAPDKLQVGMTLKLPKR